MADRYVNPRPQYYDNSGNILVQGKLWFYESGTTTPKTTYADVNETTANTNPVLLTGDGRVPNVFYSGTARVILTDNATTDPFDVGSQIFDISNVGNFGSGTSFEVWSNAVEYNQGAIVEGSDGEYYRSLVNNNIGNDPISIATAWEQVSFISTWNTNVSYALGDVVKTSNGVLYRSLTSSNAGNDPALQTGDWATATETWIELDSRELSGQNSYTLTGIPDTAKEIRVTVGSMTLSGAGDEPIRVRLFDDGTEVTTGYICWCKNWNGADTQTGFTGGFVLYGEQDDEAFGEAIIKRNGTSGEWIWRGTGSGSTSAGTFRWTSTVGVYDSISGVMDGILIGVAGS
jgi:hypothetical protein